MHHACTCTCTYESLIDLARVLPPRLAAAVDGAPAADGETVDLTEHDPVAPPVSAAAAPVGPVPRRHQGALHRHRDAGLARAGERDELQQVALAAGDEQDGRPRRGARRLPRPGERARVVVPAVAAGAVAVEAEHALVGRRRRQGPAACVARTVGCGAVARARAYYYGLESAGREVEEEEEREEGQGRRGREHCRLHAGRHGQRQTPMDRPLPGHALNSEVNRVVGTELKSEEIVPAASQL